MKIEYNKSDYTGVNPWGNCCPRGALADVNTLTVRWVDTTGKAQAIRCHKDDAQRIIEALNNAFFGGLVK